MSLCKEKNGIKGSAYFFFTSILNQTKILSNLAMLPILNKKKY